VVAGDHYHEGFYSLLDAEPRITFDRFERGAALAREVQRIDGVQRIAAFSKGFYKLQQDGARVLVSDLRMGQEPAYIFTFAVAERHSPPVPLSPPEQVGVRPDIERGLPWLWRRMQGEPLPPPR
jgi:inner membrane protein